MAFWRRVSEDVARKTTRRGFFGKGADVAFGALAGVAAGSLTRAAGASAAGGTVCAFPGPPCRWQDPDDPSHVDCRYCLENGVCAKPCVILTTYYASGCWVSSGFTCCDCDCQGQPGYGGVPLNSCGCGSDYHNKTVNCPER